MVNTIRTENELLSALFQAGQADGSITSQDMRDMIVSLGNGAYENSTVVFDDLLFDGLSIRSSGPSSPTLTTFRDSLQLNAFIGTGTQINEGFFSIHVNHDYKAMTDMSWHIHWTHNVATPSGNVKWMIDYSTARGYGAGVFPTVTTLSTVQAAPTQYIHSITPDTDMVIAANIEIEPDTIMLARIYRDPADAADTFTGDAFLLHCDIHYEATRMGTIEKNRPFTSGGF